jgi:hypothetical protein
LNIKTISNGQVAPGAAQLWSVNINTGTFGAVLKIYNDTSAVTANLVATIDASAVVRLWFGVYCQRGIFYDLSAGASDVTIGYT